MTNKTFKTITIIILGILIVAMLGGCGPKDYATYFQVDEIIPIWDALNNRIEIDYSITNKGNEDDKIFSVTIDGNTEKYSIAPDATKRGKVIIDFERPDNDILKFDVSYVVSQNNKEIWQNTFEMTYDCTEIFNHKATIEYKESNVQVNLEDYQNNVFDITSLFDDFDADKMHKIEVENATNDLIGLFKTNSTEGNHKKVAYGKYLGFETFGKKEANDTYHFSNDLKIIIKEAIAASSVDWENETNFEKNADYKTYSISGVSYTNFKMIVSVNNPSDEKIYGTVLHFYVNDKMVSDEYLAAASKLSIYPGKKEELYNYTSGPVWKTTGITDIDKFGMEIQLEDEEGNIIYSGIKWLELE